MDKHPGPQPHRPTGPARRHPYGAVLTGLVAGWLMLAAAAGAQLQAKVQEVIRGATLGPTEVSVLIVDLRTGRTLVDIEADEPRVPASNMKLITTAAALHRLGPDFQFTTALCMVADDSAEAVPSLLVRGDGDPTFGDPTVLAQAGLEVDDLIDLWVKAVADTGQKRFKQLWIDDRVFDREFTHPAWPADQLQNYYCAQVAGLNFHENLMAVLPVPAAQKGQAPTVQLFPYFPSLKTANRATTGDADVFNIQRRPGTNQFTFNGTVRNRRSAPFHVTVHDPPVFFGQFFQHKLKQAGIRVDEVARVPLDAPPPADRVTTLHLVNTTLPGVVDRTNQDSQNMFAEALFKRLGYELTSAPGSYASGAAAVRLFLKDELSGRVGLAGVRVDDGSGMSPHNRLTARTLVELLRLMHQDKQLGPIFTASLAHAGHTGTLRRRMSDLGGDVYAKSGYLGASADYASSLAGYYVQKPVGSDPTPPRVYAFSLIFNGFKPPLSNHKIKDTQDKILAALETQVIAAPAQR